MQGQVEKHLAAVKRRPTARRRARTKRERDAQAAFRRFLERLRTLRILDPACGSGNFLYVALQRVKDLEKEAILWAWERLPWAREFPRVDPSIVHGIETNDYAAELARVTVWIGEIQWMRRNGYKYQNDPILRPLDNIEHRDAILRHDAKGNPIRAEWPNAEFIIGNPPFLGGKKLHTDLKDSYVDQLFTAWDERVPREADLVTYWHEKAREMIAARRARRAGLIATNSIRGGASRRVLDRIKETGDIFFAWDDEPWVVEGAAVRVSIIGQDDGSESARTLDGDPVATIHADLTGGATETVDLTKAQRLPGNAAISFMGDTKGGAFDIPGDTARDMLRTPGNPNGHPNADVIVPWVNGLDITRRPRDMFIIDFGVDMSQNAAARYEAPFAHVKERVAPVRAGNKREQYKSLWWIHVEPRPALRAAIKPLPRFIATPTVAKHRLFVWMSRPTLPDHQLIAIARDDDYAFGVLHSRAHELWSLRKGTWLGKGNDPRYTPTTTFETFPFPWRLNTPLDALTPEQRVHHDAIAAAAHDLNELRERWLNPPDLVRYEPDVVPELPPRLLPRDKAAAKLLKRRTLTNLYNDRPTWLADLHATLDQAVFAAYGWSPGPDKTATAKQDAPTDEDILRNLLALNLERASAAP